MKQTVASLVVDSLVANGIDSLYCVPGVQNDAFFDALFHRRDTVRPIQARHEQGAAYMALGAALATGKPQAFCVVPGPGFLNSTAALCTAFALNAPVFGIVGDNATAFAGKRLGQLHEINGQLDIARNLAKHAVRIDDADAAPTNLAAAWSAARSYRPGPVIAEIPVDLWLKGTSYRPEDLKGERLAPPPFDQRELEKASELISAARRPLVITGGGAQDFSGEIRTLARRIGAGVSAFRTGHGVMPTEDLLSIEAPVAHAVWPECDLVIGLGTRLVQQKTLWGLDARVRVIHVDIDADALAGSREIDLALHADLADVLPRLLSILPRQDQRDAWRARLNAARDQVDAIIGAELKPQLDWLAAIRAAMPRDAVFVDELTQLGYVARFAIPKYGPRTFLSTGYQGTLGWGIAAAIGAANARRDVAIVSVTGDGGALFTIGELATAVHHEIPINIIVMNDNAYGNVRTIQRESYGGRLIASDLTSPDFVELARSFGFSASRAESPQELEKHLAAAIARGGRNLVEVPVGEFPSPWKHVMLGKARGEEDNEWPWPTPPPDR